MKKSFSPKLALAVAAALSLGHSAQAANTANNYTGATNGSLLTPGNWSLTHVPTVTEDAVFTATTGIRTLTAGNLTVGSFNVTAATGTFSIRNETTVATNSTLTLGGAGNLGNSVSGTAADLLYAATGSTFSILGPNGSTGSGVLNLVLGQSGNFNAAGTISISAAISDGGSAFGITKTGVGTLTLSGANSYTGATTVNAGTLSVASLANGGSNSGIGASTNVAGNLILNGGALQYTGAAVSTDRLFSLQSSSTIDASGASNAAVNFTNTGSMGFNGGTAAKTLTLTGTSTGANTIAAVIGNNTGATSVTKNGTGTWVLTGANTYSGGTTINVGDNTNNVCTLSAGNDAAFGTGTVTFGAKNGATVASATNVTLANNFTAPTAFINFTASGGTMVLNGNITGSQQMNLTPTNKITLHGTNTLTSGFGGQGLNIGAGAGGVDFTGLTTVSGASTAAGAGYLLISGTAVSVKTGGTLTINGTTNASKASVIVSNSAATGTLSVDGGTLNIGANMGSIVANGAGSTGVLTINTGTATFTSGATVGTTDVRSFIAIGQNSTASGTSTGTINLNGGTLATGRNFVRDGAGTADASGSATFNFAGGTLKALANQTDWLNSATINTNQLALTSVTATNTSTIDAGGFSVAINSAISGTGGFNITNSTGTGTVTFGGANTYSGATTVSAGTFSLGNALALQNSALDTTASIAGTSTAGLKTTVTTLTMGGLTGNKDLASVFTTTSGGYSGVTALTLNPGTGVTNAYSGVIADGAAGMTLTKTGLGTQTLTGANTYTGGTIVTTGTLLVKNTTGSGTGTGTVSVSGTLGGTGIITGDTTINSGGVLTAGATTAATDIGTLAFSGALTLASLTSTINLQAASTSSYDKFTVGGALTYNGIFSVSDTGGFDLSGQNGTYNLFSGFTSQTGDFASVTVDGIGLSLVGSTWSGTNAGISYSFSETSGSLDITAVPEPSTWVGAGLITGLAGWSQRRRLQKLALRA